MTDDFLSRWSRRKRAADTVPAAASEAAVPPPAEPAPPAPDDAEGKPAPDGAEEKDDATLLAELGLKDPDEMGPGDDFAAFLRAALPQHLKTRALRRLWRSNPALACVDGLNDYDGDFRATNVPEGGLKTAYRVGRGIVRRIAEADADAGEAEAAGVAATPEPDENPAQEGMESPDEEVAGLDRPDAPAADVPAVTEEPAPPGPTRRRMTFRT